MPPASVKYASYVFPCGQNGKPAYPNAMSTTQTTSTTPKMPVRSGSRSRCGLRGTSPLLDAPRLFDKGAPPLAGIHLAAERQQDVAAGRSIDLDRHGAEVDVEERPVGAERGQPQVI